MAGTISSRYKTITRRLNTDFWSTTSETSHSLYVGSYGRNTATQGFSDLDMIFQLPYSVYQQYNNHAGNGQSALLQAVRQSIQKTYSTTNIGADGQVVQVPFTDGITLKLSLHLSIGMRAYFSERQCRRELADHEPKTRD